MDNLNNCFILDPYESDKICFIRWEEWERDDREKKEENKTSSYNAWGVYPTSGTNETYLGFISQDQSN